MINLLKKKTLPGFSLSLGYAMLYFSLIVLIPLSALFLKSLQMDWGKAAAILSSPRIWAACQVSIVSALSASVINVIFGLAIAWTLARYDFFGKKVMDALVDIPFALPTAVAGISLTSLYSESGAIGSIFDFFGIKVAYTQIGIVIAMSFVGIPFMVRTVQPILEDLDVNMEDAAASLGAGWWQTFVYVIFPILFPSIISGFAMSFARAVGEYGSVIFIAGNIPMKTEIAPLLIVSRLEEYDIEGASVIAMLLLTISFGILLALNLAGWLKRRNRI